MDKWKMKQLAWVMSLQEEGQFRFEVKYDLCEAAGILSLVDEVRPKITFNKPGALFFVQWGSHGQDYRKVIKALFKIKDVRAAK